MENKEVLSHVVNAMKELDQLYKRFEKLGIELNIFDNVTDELEKAASELMPNGFQWVEENVADFDIDELERIEKQADSIESVTYGRNVNIKYLDGSIRTIERTWGDAE